MPVVGIKLYVPAVVNDCDPVGNTGVTPLLAELAALVPIEFVAVTVNEYDVPDVNPGIDIKPEPD
jgi:hypothetical protein